MSLKPIKTPSAPIKPHAVMTYHQVKLCMLPHVRWIWTIEFSNSQIFAITDSGPIDTVIDIVQGFYFFPLISPGYN